MWRKRALLDGVYLPVGTAIVVMSGFLVYRTVSMGRPEAALDLVLFAVACGSTVVGLLISIAVLLRSLGGMSLDRRVLGSPGWQLFGATLCALGYQIGRRLERPFLYEIQAVFVLSLVGAAVLWTWLRGRSAGSPQGGCGGRAQDGGIPDAENLQSKLPATLLFAVGGVLALLSLIPLLRRERLEDVFITLRYGYHLAAGGGIRWNLADPAPTEGYTTFTWMVLGALGEYVSTYAFHGLQIASTVCFFVLVALVFQTSRELWDLPRSAAGLPAAMVLACPAMPQHAASGMETLFFAVTLIGLSWLALRWLRQPSDPRWPRCLGVAILVSGLTRPEGLLYGGLLIAMVMLAEWRRVWLSRPAVGLTLTLMLPGGAYFLWRWIYFGHGLPNSFHHKQSGISIWTAATRDVMYTDFLALVALPYLALLGYGLVQGRIGRAAWLFVAPSLLCIGYYTQVLPVSGNQYRFFIAFLAPLMVAASGELTRLTSWVVRHWRIGAIPAALAALVLVSVAPFAPALQTRWTALAGGVRYDESRSIYMTLGRVLQGLPPDGVIGVGEVGKIGYMLKDRTLIDILGLNDSYLARHPFSGAYLDRRHVEVVAIPAYPGARQGLYAMVYRSIGEHFSELDERFQCVGGVDDHFQFDIFLRRGDEARAADLFAALSGHDAFLPGRCLSRVPIRP